jgi:hypothetical protein
MQHRLDEDALRAPQLRELPNRVGSATRHLKVHQDDAEIQGFSRRDHLSSPVIASLTTAMSKALSTRVH